jgi:hypothetical protein
VRELETHCSSSEILLRVRSVGILSAAGCVRYVRPKKRGSSISIHQSAFKFAVDMRELSAEDVDGSCYPNWEALLGKLRNS